MLTECSEAASGDVCHRCGLEEQGEPRPLEGSRGKAEENERAVTEESDGHCWVRKIRCAVWIFIFSKAMASHASDGGVRGAIGLLLASGKGSSGTREGGSEGSNARRQGTSDRALSYPHRRRASSGWGGGRRQAAQ